MLVEPGPIPASAPAPDYRWYHKAGAIVFTIVCFELGVLLLVFPWTEYWEANYFAGLHPAWAQVWRNPYFRGAFSGIGLANIFISFVEIVRLRRFSLQ